MAEETIKSFRYLEDLLTREDGSTMTVEEATKKHYGFRTVWVAALNSAIRDQTRRPRLRGYPPRIFISYRWESDEHKGWIKQLAETIADRGFEIRLDQLDAVVDSHLDVPKYVGTLASCQIFLAVITSSYCEVAGPRFEPGAGGPDGWVFDEHQSALRLARAGMLELIAVLKEGERLPTGFGPANTIDVRDVADPIPFVAGHFEYQGPVFTPDEQSRLIGLLETTDQLLARDDSAAALRELLASDRFATTFEYRRQLALTHALSNNNAEAIRIATELLEQESDPDSKLLLAGTLSDCGDKKGALRYLIQMAKRQHLEPKTHYLLGNVLDDLGSYEAASLHLEYALTAAKSEDAVILNDLGMVYRHRRQLESAERCFRRALAAQPGYELAVVNLAATLASLGRVEEATEACADGIAAFPSNTDLVGLATAIRKDRLAPPKPAVPSQGRSFTCDHCGGIYRIDPSNQAICGDCGTVHRFGENCSACGNDGIVPLQMLELPGISGFKIGCPICRRGGLTVTRVTSSKEASEPQTLPENPSELLDALCAGETVAVYLAAEIDHRLVPTNRCLLICILAHALLYADSAAAHALHRTARQLGENPGRVLDFPLESIPTFTAEVGVKRFESGERIEEPSQVIRGAARVVNALQDSDCERALDVALRFTWPRVRRILLAGIYGRAQQLGKSDITRSVLDHLTSVTDARS